MALRIHHLNCMSLRPLGGRLIDGRAGWFERARFVSHCLLVETGDGLALIDTGLGLGDVLDPQQRLSGAMLSLFKPQLRAEMTALRQIERMGFRAADVRDIVLTHLDFEQAGGLDDFPRARVHLLLNERDHAFAQKSWLDRQRYRPQQWSTRNRWVVYDPEAGGEPWMGLKSVRALVGLPPEILILPLAGHTRGHAGVAVHGLTGWHLHAGDAFHDPRELNAKPRNRLGLRLLQSFMAADGRARADNTRRLRELHRHHPDITIFCSHDAASFERLSGRAADTLPDAVAWSARDPYAEKIVRRPMEAAPSGPLGVPGLEVTEHESDALDFEPVPFRRDDTAHPRQ